MADKMTITQRMAQKHVWTFVLIVCGAAMAIGTFLPWSVARAPGQELDRSGMQLGAHLTLGYIGFFALVPGVLVLAIGIIATRIDLPGWMASIAGPVALVTVFQVYPYVGRINDQHSSITSITFSTGYGIWIVLVAGVIAFVFGIQALLTHRTRRRQI
jgi:hypothetical protein